MKPPNEELGRLVVPRSRCQFPPLAIKVRAREPKRAAAPEPRPGGETAVRARPVNDDLAADPVSKQDWQTDPKLLVSYAKMADDDFPQTAAPCGG